ncbi:MAG: hypothetical protein OXE55_05045 [Flavobacteriaceae bacterium]|nr:hypothetical protein [Flavobacteriaceae bacterium]
MYTVASKGVYMSKVVTTPPENSVDSLSASARWPSHHPLFSFFSVFPLLKWGWDALFHPNASAMTPFLSVDGHFYFHGINNTNNNQKMFFL